MMINQRGGLSAGIRGFLCKILCQHNLYKTHSQNCENCVQPEQCEKLVDEMNAYIESLGEDTKAE